MAFAHGKATKTYFNQYDLSTYLNSANISMSADTAEVTTFQASAKAYIPGLKDATLQVDGFYDGSAAAVDVILNAALAVDGGLWSVYPEGDTYGNYGYALQSMQNAYAITSTKDDATKITAGAQSKVGAERVISLHALATKTTSVTGTTHNNGAATSAGGAAYLHVTAATGTVEVSIRHSTDNFVADDSELVAFTAVTGATSERKEFTGTVKRYVRAIATLAGGESITFQIGFNRK